MKTLITFFLLISSSLSAFSQATTTCQPYFQKYYGAPTGMNDEAIGIKYLNGGGMIVFGETGSYSSVKYDGFLMRLSDDGNPLWTRIMGGGEDDKLVKVISVPTGSAYDKLNYSRCLWRPPCIRATVAPCDAQVQNAIVYSAHKKKHCYVHMLSNPLLIYNFLSQD
jgi:hypothetical protein